MSELSTIVARLVAMTCLVMAGLSAAVEARAAQNGPPPPPRDQEQRYSIEQATSDNAQLNTIAFSGLAFLTGDFAAASQLPPGKVCDFFGFQYMRDVDRAGKGHNPMFLGRVAANVHHILGAEQRRLLRELAREQAPQLEELAMLRLPLISAFVRLRDGNAPAGRQLSQVAVEEYVGEIFVLDAELSFRRAQVFGELARSLDESQRAYLGEMEFGDFNSWPDLDERELKEYLRGLSRPVSVAYMTCCSEFFSWYAGNIEADTYFCPERHGAYFGSFYLKGMPARDRRDYDIDTALTGDSGEAFLGILNTEQRREIESIIHRQRASLLKVVEIRRAIATELRTLLRDSHADMEGVLSLGRRYGELDGHMAWLYATAFARINNTLNNDQREQLRTLRGLPGESPAPAYLYSDELRNWHAPDTGFLFE